MLLIFLLTTVFVFYDLYGKNSNQVDNANQPPVEAIAACENKVDGDVCEFSDKGVTVSGICDNKPGVMACAPAKKDDLQNQDKTTSVDTGTTFKLTSVVATDNGNLPAEYTCDGQSVSPALSWAGAPSSTKEFVVLMTTMPVDGNKKWSWALYNIPNSITSINKGGSAGKTGFAYKAPCSQGPGTNTYTFTVYALSEAIKLPSQTTDITGAAIESAIANTTLAKSSLNLKYTRTN